MSEPSPRKKIDTSNGCQSIGDVEMTIDDDGVAHFRKFTESEIENMKADAYESRNAMAKFLNDYPFVVK